MVTISRLLRPFTRRTRPTAEAPVPAVVAPAVEAELPAADAPVSDAPVPVAEAPVPTSEAPAAASTPIEPAHAERVQNAPAHAKVDVALDDSAVVEATVVETVVEYSVPVLVQRPVDHNTSRAEEALYELVRERVLGMVGPGGTFTVSMRTADDDDRFFSQAFAQLIARELVSQLQASARPTTSEISTRSAGAIGTGRAPRAVHALSHESRLIA